MTSIRCRWCTKHHRPQMLCDPAKRILDALYARGMDGNMPSIEFPEPIPAEQLGLGVQPGDRLVTQLVVQAATVSAAGVPRPLLMFTGRDVYGEILPKWLYAGDEDDLTRLVTLVTDMAALAIRTATSQRDIVSPAPRPTQSDSTPLEVRDDV